MKTYILPEKNRKHLQEIWGQPIFGTENEVLSRYQEIIAKNRYKTIVTVGDYCSSQIQSDIKIFDKKVQRQTFDQKHQCAITVDNPAATIQKEMLAGNKKALAGKENICINGEEDLLVIPAVLLAKPKTLVIYGFPDKGICLLEITPALKKDFKQFLKNHFNLKI